MSSQDFFHKQHPVELSTMKGFYSLSSPWEDILLSTCMFFTFWLLTWYSDNVLQSNRGVAKPFYFFVTKKYWRSWSCFKKQNQVAPKTKKKKSKKEETDMDPVLLEKKLVQEAEKQGKPYAGLRISGIKKTYTYLPFGIKSTRDVHAVNGVYLQVPKNELLCLLGHNGAGKSSLFNIMSGLIEQTEGSAQIYGFDIGEEQEQIRKILGIVPQFDALWDLLTAQEHMRIFCQIKGVPEKYIDRVGYDLLEKVGLAKVAHDYTCTFSGGMKRRLTVAIASIGDPKIILMDEPTTGMDPVSRRAVWELVRILKRNRTMILTTHAMEEADSLADRIAIVVGGKIKCLGAPLALKNSLG